MKKQLDENAINATSPSEDSSVYSSDSEESSHSDSSGSLSVPSEGEQKSPGKSPYQRNDLTKKSDKKRISNKSDKSEKSEKRKSRKKEKAEEEKKQEELKVNPQVSSQPDFERASNQAGLFTDQDATLNTERRATHNQIMQMQ